MIRKLREEDVGELALLENRTQEVPWTDKTFRDCFAAGYPGWVIEQDNKIVSFSLISMRGDECHLLNLCVHPDYQRKGWGTDMLNHTINAALAKGALMIYLEVRQSNAKAIALYKKLGFTEIGMRRDYYPALVGRENALIFARDLGLEKATQRDVLATKASVQKNQTKT